MSASPPISDVSLRGSEPTLRANRGHPRYYSINLSARKERSGTSTPIALAVLRLIASSDFVGGLIVVKHVTVNAD